MKRDEAVRYSIKRNANRRFVTMGDKFHCFRLVDERGKGGGDRRSMDFQNIKSNNLKSSSHEKTARIIGVSPRQEDHERMKRDEKVRV